MDKTFNDLMDIVNRTKKIDEIEGKVNRPRTVMNKVQESTFDEETNEEQEIVPHKKSLFDGKDAINKFLSSPKKAEPKTQKKTTTKTTKASAKKPTSKKTKEGTKKTTKKDTKTVAKSATKKPTTKSAVDKKENAKVLADKMKLIKDKEIVKPKKSAPELDMNDPKNVELYNALKETLLAGGTDVSEYMTEDDKAKVSAKNLSELFARKKSNELSQELNQEQKAYEELFTGSFFGDKDENSSENVEARGFEGEISAEELENKLKEKEDEQPSEQISEEEQEKIIQERRSRFDRDLEEMNNRDRELDEKIADYYKRKEEKIKEYNKSEEDETEEKHLSNDYDSKKQDYADIFSGPIENRSDIVKEETPVQEEKESQEEEPKEQDFQSLYHALNSEDDEDTGRYVTPASEKVNGEEFVSEKEDTEESTSADETSETEKELETTDAVKQTFEDEEIVDNEINEVENNVFDEDEEDMYNLSSDDSDLDDYIVSSNVPVESDEEEDSSVMVLNKNQLPESQIDVLGKKFKPEPEETQDVDNDSISKQEFYSEMARLQENLLNELKGEKKAEEKEPEPVSSNKNENDTLNKALDIISQLTSQKETPKVDTHAEKVAEELIEEIDKDIKVKNVLGVEETENETESILDRLNAETETFETPTEENEVSEKAPEETTSLLSPDVALNESDLEYIVNSEKAKAEKPAYFYLSQEDKEQKKLDGITESETTSNKETETGLTKDLGDLNLNKNIANAVSTEQLVKESISENKETADTTKTDDMQLIYTIFGIEKKKMENNNKEVKVLYVASECQPFIATGGLGDVAGSLPKAISKIGGVDIRVILPLYSKIKEEYVDKFEYLGNFTVHLSWRQEYCGLFKYTLDGVTYYFIDNERYFKRNQAYGFYDDGERFAYFCKAIVESLPMLNFFPDIIHCNDWQSALVSTYIKTGNWSDFRYYKIKNIYTIHNVEYQGVYGMENLKDLFGIDNRFKNDMEYNGDINLTKAAIQFSDKFTTVSESYCDNLKQPYCSKGLNHIIVRNEYKLSGIINGIDYDFYNPKTDSIIYKNYDVETMEDKVYNKKIWQDELGLPVDARTPMLAIVSRLVSHKGIDLLTKILEDVLKQDVQLVVVGTGDSRYVDYFKYLENKYPTKVRALVDKYSIENARKAYAASDIFLMPSKVEPCGISQMIASRYGSVSIVREVGGLKDSIKDFGCEGGGNGYTFANYNPNDLLNQINRAITDYYDENGWKRKMKIVMTIDFRWEKSAEKYIDLYKSLIN